MHKSETNAWEHTKCCSFGDVATIQVLVFLFQFIIYFLSCSIFILTHSIMNELPSLYLNLWSFADQNGLYENVQLNF